MKKSFIISTIIYSSTFKILYALPPGKPDPSVLSTRENSFLRPRVFQSAQKGPTCWYYALNMIRDRIGKNHSEELSRDREIECILSKRRKIITAVRERQHFDQSIVKQLMNDPDYQHLKLWTKDGALKWLPCFEELSTTNEHDVKKEVISLVRVLKAFSNQNSIPNLEDYIQYSHCNELNKINQISLTILGKNPEDYFIVDQCTDSKMGETDKQKWHDLSAFEKRALLENYCFRVSYELYKLKVSSWHPEQGPEELANVLRKNGPMYTKGQVGRRYYAEQPQVINKIAKTIILGWEKGAKRIELQILHSVVIVGASTELNGFVYYVDPLDESDPENERPVYVSSYNNFINRLGDLRNRYVFDLHNDSAIFSHDCGYGLHSS